MRDLNDRAGRQKHLAAGADPPPAGLPAAAAACVQRAKCKADAWSDRFQPAASKAGPSSVRMPRMELVVPAVGTVRCPPAGLAQDGLQLDLRQLSCVLRWEEKMQPAPQS